MVRIYLYAYWHQYVCSHWGTFDFCSNIWHSDCCNKLFDLFDKNSNLPTKPQNHIASFFASVVVKFSLQWFEISQYVIYLPYIAHFNLELKLLNIKTIFLHGELEERIYMKPLEGLKFRVKKHFLLKNICTARKNL